MATYFYDNFPVLTGTSLFQFFLRDVSSDTLMWIMDIPPVISSDTSPVVFLWQHILMKPSIVFPEYFRVLSL